MTLSPFYPGPCLIVEHSSLDYKDQLSSMVNEAGYLTIMEVSFSANAL